MMRTTISLQNINRQDIMALLVFMIQLLIYLEAAISIMGELLAEMINTFTHEKATT